MSDIKDLLKPRYKIVADWPGIKLKVGDILIPNRIDGMDNNQWVTPDPNNRNCLYGYELSAYPHLFKKLEWWEYRKLEEMPEYVKEENGQVHKVTYAEQYGYLWMMTEMKKEWKVNLRVMCFFEPATEAEYNSIKLKQ